MLHIDPILFPFAALLLLILPLPWLFAAIAAAFVHEISHIFMIRILGGRISHIRIGAGTAEIHSHIPGTRQELLCAMSGPLGSFLLLFFGQSFPGLALCGAAQGLFNLLPIYPLDGGRIIWCFIALVSPRYADRICNWIANFTLFLLIVFSLWGLCYLSFGPVPLLIALHLLWHRKKPCKQRKIGIQ